MLEGLRCVGLVGVWPTRGRGRALRVLRPRGRAAEPHALEDLRLSRKRQRPLLLWSSLFLVFLASVLQTSLTILLDMGFVFWWLACFLPMFAPTVLAGHLFLLPQCCCRFLFVKKNGTTFGVVSLCISHGRSGWTARLCVGGVQSSCTDVICQVSLLGPNLSFSGAIRKQILFR